MISWDKARLPEDQNQQRMIFANEEWDKIFEETRLEIVKSKFREMFSSIKNQYETKGYMTPKQANVVRVCWEIQRGKAARRRGVSARSFRGLPRMVNEGIY